MIESNRISSTFWLVATAMMLVVMTAQAAITVLDTDFAVTANDGSAGDFSLASGVYSYAFNAGATSDMLVVGLSSEKSAEAYTVSYAGSNMTQAVASSAGSGGSIFYLANPSATGTIEVDFSGVGTMNGFGIGIASLYDASSGIELHSTASDSGTNGIDITTSVAGTFVMVAADANTSGSVSMDSPLTAIGTDGDVGSSRVGFGYTNSAAVGSPHTYSWTTANARGIVAAAFATIPDTTAPTISSLSPADDSINFPANYDLVATFDEDIALTGSGTIVVTNLEDNTGLTIDLSSLPGADANVTVSGADLTIVLSNDLNYATNYAVRISSDAVEDLADTPNAFAGITDNTTWNFTVASGPTYTWIQGGNPTNWNDTANWQGGLVPPQTTAGLNLIFSASSSGQIGADPGTAKVTFGSVSWSTTFEWRSFGTWSDPSTGIFVDSGTTNAARATISGNSTLTAYYVPWTLNSDLELSGNGKLVVRAANSAGVSGTGGFIVGSGTRIDFKKTHVGSEYSYTGGVTIRNGGFVLVIDGSNGTLGDGLVTIEEGGELQAMNAAMDQNVLFDVNSSGSVDAFISGGGASMAISGQYSFDLDDVTPVKGNTWQIISATCSYDAGFSVADFTEEVAGEWRGKANGFVFTFYESSGLLEATEPCAGTLFVFE